MPDPVRRHRVAVLISGRGSNMEALVTAAAAPGFPAEIVAVVADNDEAGGLALAAAAGIATRAVARRSHPDRAAFEAALDAAIRESGAEYICLAGFMRILSADFVARWPERIFNIHPSLLPAFRGLDTHARALAAGVKIHGVTVHIVTATLDDGPILGQAAVPVLADDTPDSLAARILAVEHQLYPATLARHLGEPAAAAEPPVPLFSPPLPVRG